MSDHWHDPEYPVARKPHRCIACFGGIAVGEQYVTQSGFYDGRAYRNKFHGECFDALSEDGNFEFSPGELDPPERLGATPTGTTSEREADRG